jgi:hypothetical protein
VLHGCSGSGHLLGVMPALAMPSWACAATYLSAFGIGTMLAMSIFTATVRRRPLPPSPPRAVDFRTAGTGHFLRSRGSSDASVDSWRRALFGQVGELSTKLSDQLSDKKTPAKLAFASSVFALCMGTGWTVRAMLELGVPQAAWRAAGSALALAKRGGRAAVS